MKKHPCVLHVLPVPESPPAMGIFVIMCICLAGASAGDASGPDCSRSSMDLVFVVDSSTSLRSSDFDLVKRFLVQVVQGLVVSPDHIRLALVRFSSYVDVIAYLNQSASTAAMIGTINNMAYRKGGTNTNAALQVTREEVLVERRGDREGVADVVVVVTDGKSWFPLKTAQEAMLLRQRDVEIIVLGIGRNLLMSELKAMTSGVVRVIDNFAALDDAVDDIRSVVCSVADEATEKLKQHYSLVPSSSSSSPPPPPPPPPPTTDKASPRTSTDSPTHTATTTPTPLTPTNPTTTTTTATTPTPTKTSWRTTGTLGTTVPVPWTSNSAALSHVAGGGCGEQKMDVVFLQDASYSVSNQSFYTSKRFLVALTRQLPPIGPDLVRVALVRFGTVADVIARLNQSSDVTAVIDSIEGMTYKVGSTNTGKALKTVREEVLEKRPGARTIVIVITDGKSDSFRHTRPETIKLRELHVRLVWVYIQANDSDSQAIGRERNFMADKGDTILGAASFEALDGEARMQILNASCKEDPEPEITGTSTEPATSSSPSDNVTTSTESETSSSPSDDVTASTGPATSSSPSNNVTTSTESETSSSPSDDVTTSTEPSTSPSLSGDAGETYTTYDAPSVVKEDGEVTVTQPSSSDTATNRTRLTEAVTVMGETSAKRSSSSSSSASSGTRYVEPSTAETTALPPDDATTATTTTTTTTAATTTTTATTEQKPADVTTPKNNAETTSSSSALDVTTEVTKGEEEEEDSIVTNAHDTSQKGASRGEGDFMDSLGNVVGVTVGGFAVAVALVSGFVYYAVWRRRRADNRENGASP